MLLCTCVCVCVLLGMPCLTSSGMRRAVSDCQVPHQPTSPGAGAVLQDSCLLFS